MANKRKQKVHVLIAGAAGAPASIASAAYLAARENRTTIMLCGQPLWHTDRTADGNGTVTRRHITLMPAVARKYKRKDWPSKAVVAKSDDYDGCRLCAKLLKLTPDERAAFLVKLAADRKVNNAAAKLKNQDKRQAELEALDIKISLAQVEALACLDYLESTEGELLTRCTREIYGAITSRRRCNLSLNHDGTCRAQLPSEQPHVDLPELLSIAIEAHKRSKNKFDRGQKLYVMKTPPRTCEDCGTVETYMTIVRCANCNYRLPRIGPATPRDVACRFCEALLGLGQKTFEDYSRALFYKNGDLYLLRDNRENRPQQDEIIDVNRHTMICALRFLGGVQETQQLPDDSFVLSMDDEQPDEVSP